MKTNQARGTARSAFTLVELLISVALTVFILTLFGTLFSAGNDAVRAARGSAQVDSSVQRAVGKLKRDLDHVFVGDGVSLGQAFSAANQIPSAGYFTIEENMPSGPPPELRSKTTAQPSNSGSPFIEQVHTELTRGVPEPVGYQDSSDNPNPVTLYRQGIDDRGLPVEIDVDDVLAFTVRLSGDGPDGFFYGRVPIGSVLDSELDPGKRFDQADNGIFTSPMAEVVYFLRPNRPYRLQEINRPALGSDDGRLGQPATYTLYRRELLLLSEQQRIQVEQRMFERYGAISPVSEMADTNDASIPPDIKELNPGIGDNPSYYQHYDVSARFDPTVDADGRATAYRFRFNDASAVRQRRYRYGMQWLWAGLNNLLPNAPDFAVPGYDYVVAETNVRGRNPQLPMRLYVPGIDRKWFGRPTLFESTLAGSEGLSDANYDPSSTTLYAGWNMDRPNIDYNPPASSPKYKPLNARRSESDVLLKNVLSFDVKVLDDDVFPYPPSTVELFQSNLSPGVPPNDIDTSTREPNSPNDPAQWPANRTGALSPLMPDEVANWTANGRSGRVVGNPSYLMPTATPLVDPNMIAPDFVDLGSSLRPEWPAGIGVPLTAPHPTNAFPQQTRPVLLPAVVESGRALREATGTPGALMYGSMGIAEQIPWGSQTPARWRSTGHAEAWSAGYNSYDGASFSPLANVYDTWATEYQANHYARVLARADVVPLAPTPAGFPPTVRDNINSYIPPYDRPLRGIQITIRVLEPRSGLVREFQVVHRFP